MQGSPAFRDLILVGGGHSHVEVVRQFGMKPLPGVRVTLVTRDVMTPYSGMLPGYVSGFYSYDDCHIDLSRLCAFSKTRLIHAEVCGIDAKKREVLLKGRPSLAYDVLSVDIGITPKLAAVPGAQQHTTPVKPISRFVERMEKLLWRCKEAGRSSKVAVVGGGAGGVEIAMAVQYRLAAEGNQAATRGVPDAPQVTLVTRGKVLGGHPERARRLVLQYMLSAGIDIKEGVAVERVEQGELHLQHGVILEFDECLWCTEGAAAGWLNSTGLPTDSGGFLAVKDTLQSDGGPEEVFAAGDVASCTPHPRPKAGVFAVRQGPPLAANLKAQLSGQPLQRFTPQSTFLSLISCGRKSCVATWGPVAWSGDVLWTWKDYIDRRFMAKYGDELPFEEMMMRMERMQGVGGAQVAPPSIQSAGPEAMAAVAAAKMRCGGCGAKVGADVLRSALGKLHQQPLGNQQGVVIALDSPDDAALLKPPPPGKLLVQTVDFFRSMWDDPYVFGAVAANHALGDCWAMGADPKSALAIAVLPFGGERQVEGDLVQMLSGAAQVLNAAGCTLVGGHSGEGAEMSLGFSVTGEVDEGAVMTKGGLQPGQTLILTKGLGTGTVMAAAMRGRAKWRWVEGALESMQQQQATAAQCLRKYGATGCTDVTGFGLLGHLAEMVRASKVCAVLHPQSVAQLEGAAECIQAGALSSLHVANARAASAVRNFSSVKDKLQDWPLLVDPQTSGGLLAGVPQASADACLEELREAGYVGVCKIGFVVEGGDVEQPIIIEC